MNAAPLIIVDGITQRGEAEAIRNRLRAQSFREEDGTTRRLVFCVSTTTDLVDGKRATERPYLYPAMGNLDALFNQSNPNDPAAMWLRVEDVPGKHQEIPLNERVACALDSCREDPMNDDLDGAWGVIVDVHNTWPDPKELGLLAEEYPDLDIAIRVSDKVLRSTITTTDNNMAEMWAALDKYAYRINHLLLDFSGDDDSENLIQQEFAKDVLFHMRKRYPMLGLIVGGRLCAERVWESANMLLTIPRLSTYARGAIRIPSSGGGLLDIDAATGYAAAVLQITTEN